MWASAPSWTPESRTSALRPQARCSGQGREVAFDDLAVVLVGDPVKGRDGLRLPGGDALGVAGGEMRARHTFVRSGDVPVGGARRLVDLEAAAGVVEGGLAAAQHRVHAGALPLAPCEVDRLADLAP